MENDILIIIMSLVFSSFFSGMEIAFISSNRIYLEIEKKQKSLSSKILNKITRNDSKFIVTMLLGNNIMLVIYGVFMGKLILNLFFTATTLSFDIIIFQTIISTFIILIVAEFLPKVLFQIYANRAVKIFALPSAFFYFLFFIFTTFITRGIDFILKTIFKTEAEPIQKTFSKVELGNFIEQHVEELESPKQLNNEVRIFKNALDFQNSKVRDVMIPRAEILAVEVNTEVEEVKKIFTETGFSKILVYKNNIDDVIGYIHVFEIFKKPSSIKNIVFPIESIPEPMSIHNALNKLIKQRKSLAVVFDEYGGTSGIVTIEDIVEELFGEIEDEHDNIDYLEKKINDNKFEFSARLKVDYINEKYILKLPENDLYETIGGLIMHHTGKIPKKGDIIKVTPYQIEVKKVSSTKIEDVLIEIKEEK